MEDLTEKMFISTQGPPKNTFFQFWKMIYNNNCKLILMLCNLYEDARVKCDQYWPDSQEKKLTCSGNNQSYMEIAMISEKKILDDLIIERKFQIKYCMEDEQMEDELKHKTLSETKEITQLHIISWPDHSVPQNNSYFKLFNYLVNLIYSNYKEDIAKLNRHSPTLIHCSAGIGRTGTFISIYNLFDHLNRQFLALKEKNLIYKEEDNTEQSENLNCSNNYQTCKIAKSKNDIFFEMSNIKYTDGFKDDIEINEKNNLFSNSLNQKTKDIKQENNDTLILFSVFAIVRKLREQRFLFVTDLCQYKIIYKFAYSWIRFYLFGIEEDSNFNKDDQIESPVAKNKNKPYILKEKIVLNSNTCTQTMNEEKNDYEIEDENEIEKENKFYSLIPNYNIPKTTKVRNSFKDMIGSPPPLTKKHNVIFNKKIIYENYNSEENIEKQKKEENNTELNLNEKNINFD